MSITFISLDPPYVLDAGQAVFSFGGWCEVNDEDAPQVSLSVNGRPLTLETYPRPQVRNHIPGLRVRGLRARADFRELLAGADTQQDRGGFLLEATVTSDHRVRTFEYAVTPAWLRAVFGAPLKPRPVPPAPLQIRVAGAAAGAFCATGQVLADAIEQVAAEGGFTWPDGARVLDFGCGPGRLLGALQPRHPRVDFDGCDLDAEAIAWDRAAMGDVARFAVSGVAPPLPYSGATFDLVMAISVFTHLPEDQQFAWLDELARVVKPGGLVLATTLNPHVHDLPDDVGHAADRAGFAYWREAPTTEGLPDSYRLAYHSHSYLRRAWARGLEVVRIGACDVNGAQDSVLLRRAGS